MGRRRKSRKKLLLKPKKTLPKVFTCPHCGAPLVNVKIDKKEGKVLVNCGNCGLEAEFNYIPGLLPVDYFNKFVDLYYQGSIKPKKEVTISLTQLTPQTNNPLINEGETETNEGLGGVVWVRVRGVGRFMARKASTRRMSAISRSDI